MQFFFSRSLGDRTGLCPHSATTSPDYAKSLLKKLVDEEDKKKPLSDQKLCQLMADRGCDLSRRTVAKYRDELGIPSTTGRKEYE
jgi:RNA polymerase sigma-54 factor